MTKEKAQGLFEELKSKWAEVSDSVDADRWIQFFTSNDGDDSDDESNAGESLLDRTDVRPVGCVVSDDG